MAGRTRGVRFVPAPHPWFVLLLLLSGAVQAELQPGTPSEEHFITAAYVFNFAKFTEWPADTWHGADDALLLCTSGVDGVVGALGHLAGERVKGHPVAVRGLERGENPADCHVLYLVDPAHGRAEELLVALEGAPVLTIGHLARAGGPGPMIRLFNQDDRIRFNIDLGRVRDSNLDLNSRLLGLAFIVGR